MKIAIVNSYKPFDSRESELFAEILKNKLIQNGHQAMVVKIPFSTDSTSKIFDSILACRLLEFDLFFDLVIALSFPTYCINHRNKLVWLMDNFIPGEIANRNKITRLDNRYLSQAKRIFSISREVNKSLLDVNGLNSEVLTSPLVDENTTWEYAIRRLTE